MADTLAAARSAASATARRALLPTLVVLFFLSGMCGLIYQVLWLRLLSLVFGVTVYAASTVLASFMGGLALGSFLAGRHVDRARRPLLWYGVAEIIVGLSALATPGALEAVERLYVALYPSLVDAPVLLTLARFALSFAVLLVPTTLMGATLPIIIKSSLLQSQGVGERIGLLYAINTAGAIFGTLLAGFYLIGGIGMRASFLLAAGMNVLVGLAAVIASRALENRPAQDRGEDIGGAAVSARTSTPALSEGTRRLVLVVFALSGFTSLALEVVWFRVLALFLRTTTYAFTIMLATVLAGIALGSFVATALIRRRQGGLLLVASLEIAIAVISLLSIHALARSYEVLALLGPLARSAAASEAALMLIASVFAIFPTTLLMGIAFPLGLHLFAGEGTDAAAHGGERVGLFYSLNVFGAILGALAGGFLLLPRLGSHGSAILVASIILVFGLLLLTRLPASQRRASLRRAAVGSALFAAAAFTLPDLFQASAAHRYPGERILWRAEGIQTTVSVHEKKGSRVLYLDGLHQADDTSNMIHIHGEIGSLPMALHPDPRETLVIGLGGGVTPGAMSRHREMNIDVVELSETVVQGARWLSHANHDVLRRPNVHLRVDDGRNYLLLTPKRYDLITADLIQPVHAGAGNLYSAEYFRLVRRALKEDGIVLQWIGSHRYDVHYKLILRTFLSVFPDTTLWMDGNYMVGTRRPLRIDPAAFARKRNDAATRAALVSVGLDDFSALLSKYTAGPEELRRFVGPGPILTDDQPRIEYFLSLPLDGPRVDLSAVRGDVRRHIHP